MYNRLAIINEDVTHQARWCVINPLKTIALVGTIGAELAVFTLLGFWVGRWLDNWLGTSPLFLLLGVLGGLGLGIYGVFLLIKPLMKS